MERRPTRVGAESFSEGGTTEDLRNILVLGGFFSVQDRFFLAGIQQFVGERLHWRIHRAVHHQLVVTRKGELTHRITRRAIAGWDIAGVLNVLPRARIAEASARLPVPIVNVHGGAQLAGLPQVGVDDNAIGRMAAEHLLDTGADSFHALGWQTTVTNAARLEGFRRALAERGIPCELHGREYQPPQHGSNGGYAAIFAPEELLATAALVTCRQHGLLVPEQVAVLCAVDDVRLCESTVPTLSSIRIPCEAAGYQAAVLLDDLIEGKPAPAEPILLQPEAVVERQSTSRRPIRDPDVARAVHIIRQSAVGQITPEEVAGHVGVSRRHLDMRFLDTLGRTVFQEIRRAQLDHIKRLLRDTDKSVKRIALECGFDDSKSLGGVFKRFAGTTPGAYRAQFRKH
jgi:LacI family transcriptional regulator, galactose operon repressor